MQILKESNKSTTLGTPIHELSIGEETWKPPPLTLVVYNIDYIYGITIHTFHSLSSTFTHFHVCVKFRAYVSLCAVQPFPLLRFSLRHRRLSFWCNDLSIFPLSVSTHSVNLCVQTKVLYNIDRMNEYQMSPSHSLSLVLTYATEDTTYAHSRTQTTSSSHAPLVSFAQLNGRKGIYVFRGVSACMPCCTNAMILLARRKCCIISGFGVFN